ncbi:hypothetical protein E9549_17190 [Blastococcus sp. MG754426]|uniref:hypothetical protein n=1 Tax=unclassified Blastococcus TaxID=2619396 RepID=UPI001EEFF43A|nr:MULTISPECIES: hypothetical protein [unclassified Blastococcus]MCF6509123.1 hypothetical protein [Blastococcus sp. MG754426]MCF6512921.1 hypothetical protein [Blastococcus sp. MG754427]MCF6735921.1 hypothetical protein [Blastococcus sp. KM273129]
MTITTTITAASADLLGRGGVDARTGGLIMTGPAAQHEGTGLSSAACRGEWTAVLGGDAGAAAFDRRPKSLRTVERPFVPTYLPQHDGTTLGIRSPGRPLS